jgi:hypothetical protein
MTTHAQRHARNEQHEPARRPDAEGGFCEAKLRNKNGMKKNPYPQSCALCVVATRPSMPSRVKMDFNATITTSEPKQKKSRF